MLKLKAPYKDIAELITAFIAAWIFYQGLAFALGTPLPVVSVVSDSMFHGTQFEEWWSAKSGYYLGSGISRNDFLSFPFMNGLAQGDLLVVVRPDGIKAGDVIIYQPQHGCFSTDGTIIHRIVKTEDGKYTTKGDSNPVSDRCTVKKEQILGKAAVIAPLLGYPRLALFAFGV